MIKLITLLKSNPKEEPKQFDKLGFYQNYYKNLSPSNHTITVRDGEIVIGNINNNSHNKIK